MLDSSNLETGDRTKLAREAFLSLLAVIGLAVVYLEWETSRLDRAKVNAEIEAQDVASERDQLADDLEAALDELEAIRGGSGHGDDDDSGGLVRGPDESNGESAEDDSEVSDDATLVTLDDAVVAEECDWRDGTSSINGTSYDPAINCESEANNTFEDHVGHMEFMVPEDATEFVVTVGFDDESVDSNSQADFAVLDSGDLDRSLELVNIGFGASEQLVVNVEEVVRIRLGIGQTEEGRFGYTFIVSWAEPHFR